MSQFVNWILGGGDSSEAGWQGKGQIETRVQDSGWGFVALRMAGSREKGRLRLGFSVEGWGRMAGSRE